jgi:AcrR family transcriptional regulator
LVKVTSARLEIRREQILDAAIACFARNGFHRTTMADIAAEAGITPAAIYRYFASKEDVIEASARARGRARTARFQAAQQRAGSIQVLNELVDGYLRRLVQPDTNSLLEVQLFSEALSNPRVRDSVRESWRDVVARFEEIVRRGQVQGEIDRALEPNTVGRMLLAAYLGLLVQKAIDPDVDVWKCAEILKALYSVESSRDVGRGLDETGSRLA